MRMPVARGRCKCAWDLRDDAVQSLNQSSCCNIARFHPLTQIGLRWEQEKTNMLCSGMTSANRSADQSAGTPEQDWRSNARVWILVSFSPKGRPDAKADDSPDQGMAPVASLPPHVSVAPPARILDPGWRGRNRSTVGKLWRCLVILRGSCDVFVLGVHTPGNKGPFRNQTVVGSLLLFGLCQSLRRGREEHSLDQEKGGK
jgi:hypothetical protein